MSNNRQLNEISKKTLGSYLEKAAQSYAGYTTRAAAARDAGTTVSRLSHAKDPDTVKKLKDAEDALGKEELRMHGRANKRARGIIRAKDRLTKEEVLDEVSNKTLRGYIVKSSGDADRLRDLSSRSEDEHKSFFQKKYQTRKGGVDKAVDKLFKKRHSGVYEQELDEVAPSDKETWVKKNKQRFIDRYGEKKGKEILYATAWKLHNKEDVDEQLHEDLAVGDRVWWHYRGAIGHGTIKGIAKKGTTSATTEYEVSQHDHHPGEKAVLHHFGSALHKASGTNEEVLDETMAYPFVKGDHVKDAKGKRGTVCSHNRGTFSVKWQNGKKTLHDQTSGKKWAANGLTDEKVTLHEGMGSIYQTANVKKGDKVRVDSDHGSWDGIVHKAGSEIHEIMPNHATKARLVHNSRIAKVNGKEIDSAVRAARKVYRGRPFGEEALHEFIGLGEAALSDLAIARIMQDIDSDPKVAALKKKVQDGGMTTSKYHDDYRNAFRAHPKFKELQKHLGLDEAALSPEKHRAINRIIQGIDSDPKVASLKKKVQDGGMTTSKYHDDYQNAFQAHPKFKELQKHLGLSEEKLDESPLRPTKQEIDDAWAPITKQMLAQKKKLSVIQRVKDKVKKAAKKLSEDELDEATMKEIEARRAAVKPYHDEFYAALKHNRHTHQVFGTDEPGKKRNYGQPGMYYTDRDGPDAKITSVGHRADAIYPNKHKHTERGTHYIVDHTVRPPNDTTPKPQHMVHITATHGAVGDRVMGIGYGETAADAINSAHSNFQKDHKAHKYHLYKKLMPHLVQPL